MQLSGRDETRGKQGVAAQIGEKIRIERDRLPREDCFRRIKQQRFSFRPRLFLFFTGRIYSLVFRFGAMSDTDRNRLEQWTKNLVRLP